LTHKNRNFLLPYSGVGGLCAFLLYGCAEVVYNIVYAGGRNFFLTPLDVLFLYAFLGMLFGLIAGLFIFPFRKRFARKLKSPLLPFVLSTLILLFVDAVLYLISDYSGQFYILFPVITAVFACFGYYVFFFIPTPTMKDGKICRNLLLLFNAIFCIYLLYPVVLRHNNSGPGRPNIILVVMDNTRADFLGCYGSKSNNSPNIDSVAAEGLLFEQFYSNADWTLPAHASMFTGLYPSSHTVIGTKGMSTPSLVKQFHTLGEYMQEAGYLTVAFSDNLFVSRTYGFDQGFSSFTEMFDTSPPYIVLRAARKLFISSFFTKYKPPTTDMIMAMFKAWFFRFYTGSQPFFAFLNLMDCHLRWNPPPSFLNLSSPKRLKRAQELATVDMASRYLAGKVKITQEEFSDLKSLYAGELAYLDSRLGSFFSFLKKNDVWDNTMLIITSDHGENIGEHGLMFHCFSANNTITHVPMILHFSHLFPLAKRITAKAETVDILPTILQAARIKIKGLVGESLLDIAQGRKQKNAVFTEVYGKMNIYRWIKERFPQENWSRYAKNYKACYFGNYKYIVSSTGENSLTNQFSDFGESKNLINNMPKTAGDGQKIIDEFKSKAAPQKHRSANFSLTNQQKQILRSVGYAQ